MKIESEVFYSMRQKFNEMLQGLVREMQNSKSNEGCISLKLNLFTYKKVDIHKDEYTKPMFNFDISAELKKKAKINGEIRDEYKLFFDEETMQYDIVPVPDEQIKMEI